jgi:hypothetical protein
MICEFTGRMTPVELAAASKGVAARSLTVAQARDSVDPKPKSSRVDITVKDGLVS